MIFVDGVHVYLRFSAVGLKYIEILEPAFLVGFDAKYESRSVALSQIWGKQLHEVQVASTTYTPQRNWEIVPVDACFMSGNRTIWP